MRKDQNFVAEFTNLHNRLYGKVFSFVRLRIKDSEEVKDIVQEVFLKAYNSWSSGEFKDSNLPDENSAKNFLYIMARQKMIDLWRSGRSRLQVDLLNKNSSDNDEDLYTEGDFDKLESDDPLPGEMFIQNEGRQLVLDLLNKLKKEERELLILRFLEEMEYKELARIYSVSEDNIRQRVSRGLQNLRKVANK